MSYPTTAIVRQAGYFPAERKMRLVRDMPCPRNVRDALYEVGELLDRDICWLYQRRFHFPLEDDGWTLAVSPDSAGRIRFEACHWTRPVATLWKFDDDEARLADVVRELAAIGGAYVASEL